MAILQQAPHLLRLYGHDPSEILATIEASRQERARIDANFETIRAGFRDDWRKWLLQYKQVLSTQS